MSIQHKQPRAWSAMLPLEEMRTPAAVKKYAEKKAQHIGISWIVWLQEYEGTLLARTFAAKNTRKEGLQLFEVMREVPGERFLLQRNMWMSCMTGWQCWFPKANEIIDCDWQSQDVKKRPGVWTQIINPEKVTETALFQYCGWRKDKQVPLLDYLHLWLEKPGIEFFGKMGMRPKASLVAKAEKDGNFRKWLRNLTPEQVDQINLHGPSAALEAYKTHEDIAACDARMSRHRSLHITVRRHAKEAVEAGWSAEKIRDYLTQQAKATGRHCYGYDIPDLNIYGDYIHAAAVLRLDLKDTKVAFPRELQRMHDLRCAQLQSIRAKEDRIKKQEMTKRFRTRAQELKRFERAGAAFCIIIPSAPEDLKKEGKALNHCVGEMGYDIKMANGKTFIAFLRKIESKETAFVTIEYDLEKKELRQCYGYHDSKPLKDAQTFADEWAAAVTKRLKAEETRERRKAEQEAREAMMKQLDPLKKKYKEATA